MILAFPGENGESVRMKKLLQYCAEMPQFSAAGVGIMSEPLIPQGLRFYSRGSGKPTGKPWVHGRYIFRYQLDGERCFNVDGTKFNMTPGDAILIPPGARHFVESSGTVLQQVALCAAFELPAKELRLRRVCKFIFHPTVQDQKLLNNAVSAFLKWLDGNAEAAGEATLFFSCFLHRLQHLNIQENIGLSVDNDHNSLVGKIVEYLAANRDHRVTLKELAHVMHVSGSAIRQTFYAKMGRPIGAYELSRRLIYSTELLRSTDLSVHEVANKCGFASANGLYRALRRAKCPGPAELRKKIRQK
ncbi:MAG: AraC family transcriptional regulator [Lentisphaerae bacterium]|nr:AraC family transcriptional regulator [Lentisphaerota bacterium]